MSQPDPTRPARRSWLAALRAGASRALRVATPAGGFVLLGGAIAAVLGAWLGWVEAWALAIAAALLIAAALPFLLGGRAYRVELHAERERVVAGGEAALRVEVTNTSRAAALPATAELPVGAALRELPIPFLGAGADTTVAVAVPTPHRGVIDVGPLTLTRRDPIGLLQRELSWPAHRRIHVHPVTAQLPPSSAGLIRDLEGEASRRLTDADLSFHAVREYVAGDARRHIHWRSTAKTGRLMVRQYEESQTARSAILFDSRRESYASPEEFELGVSVAASFGAHAVREGRDRFVATQWVPGRTRAALAGTSELPSRAGRQLLDAWAELQPSDDGAPLEQLARGLAESGRQLSLVVLITGSRVEPQRLRRAAVPFSADVALLTARCALHADPAIQRGSAAALLTIGALQDTAQLLLRRGNA
ncbi:DUF58 domain-containing protein [Leucobacter chromiireducens]|uniref:DUF58 domain-containing protein n=1 Tax=Leucobacter chromiireducens TaxID=283877 RepID=UPI000F637DCC|nr:DUF58 domain-containing protein [Leucobacter chromiireducens]